MHGVCQWRDEPGTIVGLELLSTPGEGKIMNRQMWKSAALALAICGCLAGPACRTNESPEAQVNDLQIATELKAKLASDIGPSSVTNISVNATNGVVTLSGQVDTADVKAKALAIAKAIPKVVRVVDSLQVTPKSGRVRRPLGASFQSGPPIGRIAQG